MTVHISPQPFVTQSPDDHHQWQDDLFGPAWVEICRDCALAPWIYADAPLSRAMGEFVRMAATMAEQEAAYGTVYAVRLGPEAVTEGPRHYDLGEYREDGSQRYVGTWASDEWPLQNVFVSPDGIETQPGNNRVVEFNEGTDLHYRAAVPERPGQWGVFISLALYRNDQPANLDCPRLAALRDRRQRSLQARTHPEVARKIY